MSNKQYTTATLAGGIAMFATGYLLYELALADFFASNTGTATGVMKEAPLYWSIIIGSLIAAAFLVMVIGWRGDSSTGAGLKTGALVGLMTSLGSNFVMYGAYNLANLTSHLATAVVDMTLFGVSGAVIGTVLSTASASATTTSGSVPLAAEAEEATEHDGFSDT